MDAQKAIITGTAVVTDKDGNIKGEFNFTGTEQPEQEQYHGDNAPNSSNS